MRKLATLVVCGALALGASAQSKPSSTSSRPSTAASAAAQNVSADRIKADIKFLSSDLLEGRGTGARGGDVAAEYIATQFALAGLSPAGSNGTFMQRVPMVGVTTQTGTTLAVTSPKQTYNLRLLEDAVVMDESQQPTSDVNGDVIFMGYGITAPEYQWDDYAGVDVKGKVLLMFVNEPPSQDEKFFNGRALTYYGRWTYKFEHAAKMGAAGVILIHKTDMASYGWQVVRSSWSGERAYLAGDKEPKLNLASWIQLDIARNILADAGQDLDQLLAAAGKRGFKPVPLKVGAQSHVVSKVRPFESQNVIGVVPGSDPKLKQEAIFYTAHYDHLGYRPDAPGDNIYNGANDNSSGTAILIEMARAVATATTRPKRSMYFAAVTAEEQGLWGSNYLGKNLPVPAKQVSLNLNFDSFAPLGIPQGVSAGGYDRTDFASIFQKVASDFKLQILPPEHPESGGYYRSDHFSFARVGVPAFSINMGEKFTGHPEDWVKQRSEKITKCYHQPCDEFDEGGDYRANAVVARFGIALGYAAADMPKLIQWKPGDEFEAERKAQAGQ